MSGYIGPVTRDHIFFYDDCRGLLVTLEGHYYPRADPRRLYSLLTWVDQGPVLTKKGVPRKRQPPPHKDETDMYYIAQLMHFGLKPLKTKGAAKKALLAAFGDGQDIKVPEQLQNLEVELSALWDAENEKARIRFEQMEKEREKEEEARKVEARRRHEAILTEFEENPAPEAGSSRKRKATDDGKTVQKKAKAKASGSGKKLSALDFQGRFAIEAPYLTEQWPDHASSGLKLTLSPSRGTGKHLWGSFKFGILTGIIRCGAPPKTAGETITFKWRGHEQGEGEMEYGPSNTGTITFRSDGKIRGTMEGGFAEEFIFAGVRTQESQDWVKHVKHWKEQWRSINDRSYNAASASRWGKWSENKGYQERPAGSDTTSAGEASDASDGEEIFDEAL